ncbi:MAG: transglutaminase domain-containing protein [Firmicutes bacterium]|nr:transglutaminase domain-containing protein [Bacillota bacterium]
MRKRTRKGITMALLVTLLVTVFPAELSFAAVPDEIREPAKVTTFKSTANFDQEYLRAYVTEEDDRVLKVVYRTPLETSLFRLSLYRVGEDKGDIDLDIFIQPKMQDASDGTPTYNFTYYLNMEGLEVPDGRYTIYIRRCATEADAANLKYTGSGVLNKNLVLDVEDGQVSILRYMDVISYNREIMAIGQAYDTSRYLDQNLEDIRFVLRNPATDVYATMTHDKISYIEDISHRVTSGAYTDYDKLRKIYEYTASNFYYDSVAFQTHSNQYADPYDNIRSFEYGLTSANSQQGRVYTTCQGYSAIFIALARAQGIPARMVYGHRAAVPSND